MSKISNSIAVTALLANVAALTVTPQGTTGAETWDYQIVGVTAEGNESLAVTGQTTTGNAALDGTDFNRLTWADISGYVEYKIYRSASGGTPTTLGYLGKVDAGVQQFDDTAVRVNNVGDPGTASAENTTGFTELPIRELDGDVAISIEAVGTGTYILEGSYGGGWTAEGAAFSADALRAVTVKYSKLRVSCTAFTSGSPVAYCAGDTSR